MCPIGIRDFAKPRARNGHYVDKTSAVLSGRPQSEYTALASSRRLYREAMAAP